MFNFSGGLLAGQHDSKKERTPPSRPIPVTFPSITPPEPTLEKLPPPWSEGTSRIPTHFLNLKKPSDVNLETLGLLNVLFEPQGDFETLLASSPNGAESYLPKKSWLERPTQTDVEPPSTSESSIKLLSNGRRVPDRNEFYLRAKELYFKNEDAFSNLTRKSTAEKVPLRLAHFRRFWEGLDNMAYYWDNSLDEYLPPKPGPAQPNKSEEESTNPPRNTINGSTISNGAEAHSNPVTPDEEPRKKARTAGEVSETPALPTSTTGCATGIVEPTSSTSISSSQALPARLAPPKVPWAVNMRQTSEKPPDFSNGSYRGYRIGNGAEMPDQYRLDCVRSFLEPVAWAFGVTFVPHRRPPILCLEHVRFPVRMNSVAWRGPADRLKARQGFLEGPLLGIQCRPDTDFGSTGNLEADSVLDIVRELGGMLLLAQERDREGRTEKRAGDGKWWTTQHRWGGGPGGEVGEGLNPNSSIPEDPISPTSPLDDKSVRQRAGFKDRRPRASPAEIWKVIRSGNPIWDPKIVYEAIGKDKASDWDEVFMVSSLNHHISILKLRVHRSYIRYLTEGTLPDETPSDARWFSPVLTRTRWYDLFSIDDRTEAMRGMWGVIGYLMRSQQKGKADAVMAEG
ncbi:hypothetical protein BDV96DRAFT_612646 [Lophiotrema nucula]|uniref:Uncharacterized protein n=1 Tax=Lophiotrema nucula TaxID=690887 RepID=A0A6A5Z7Z1_9PLEO|nr:hypothetical protein BDV96DRAFT_612646 [Lophiotrema nucula]